MRKRAMEPATTAQYSAFVVAHNKALSAGWGLLFGLAYAGAAVCWHAPQRANADLLFASALAVVSVCFAVAALLGHRRILAQSAITYCWLCSAWYMLGLILVRVCACVRACVCMRACVCVYVHQGLCARAALSARVCMSVPVNVCDAVLCVCVCVYLCAHTHVLACSLSRARTSPRLHPPFTLSL